MKKAKKAKKCPRGHRLTGVPNECVKCHTFLCTGCREWVDWTEGADDEHPDWCDSCASSSRVALEIGDGGVTFEVRDEGHGPTIVISLSHLGNAEQEIHIHTTRRSLRALGNWAFDAALRDYSPKHPYAARERGVMHVGLDADE